MDKRNGTLTAGRPLREIGVIGAGIVGVPMAALLADGNISSGSDSPVSVCLIQRPSPTSGWKVDALNSGRSPIGGLEPGLQDIITRTVARGSLRASHDYGDIREADVILVCVQTDKKGLEPDYGPLESALAELGNVLQERQSPQAPVVVFESTLAPTTMTTRIRDIFLSFGLVEGRDIHLGNSPNRVMPGFLVERIGTSDKIVGGLAPSTVERIQSLYGSIVREGRLLPTNSLTAEIVKTLENAYRDVRIAYAAETARYCETNDIDFYALRDAVNSRLAQEDEASSDANAVPTGGMLLPTIGVGGHCLPKDGILLLWRKLERREGINNSLILESRRINEESPGAVLSRLIRDNGSPAGKTVVLLGTAYRFNSEDTRNSPTIALALLIQQYGGRVILHDPYVRPDDQNLKAADLTTCFTNQLDEALNGADWCVICTSHRFYRENVDLLFANSGGPGLWYDGCRCFPEGLPQDGKRRTGGIGDGIQPPSDALIEDVTRGFRGVEKGTANEVDSLIGFLNREYAGDPFNRVKYRTVRELAATCGTGCRMVEPGPLGQEMPSSGFSSRLVTKAFRAYERTGHPERTNR